MTCSNRRRNAQRLQLAAAHVDRCAVRAVDRVRQLDVQVVRRVRKVVARGQLLCASASPAAPARECAHLERDGADRRRAVHAREPVLGLVPVVVLVHADLVVRPVRTDAELRRACVVRLHRDRLRAMGQLWPGGCVRGRTLPATSGAVVAVVTIEFPKRDAWAQDEPCARALPARATVEARASEVRMLEMS
jgi:hypothetical protein